METQPQVLVVELGSQVTLKIGRVLRDLGHLSITLKPDAAKEWLRFNKPRAIILSGGQHSVYNQDAPQPPEEVLTARTREGYQTRILGICYGHQWLAQKLGGKVQPHTPEYARTAIEVTLPTATLFRGTPPEQDVWMSHGDAVVALPPEFSVLARSREQGIVAAMGNGHVFGVQLHPEVSHTEHGTRILRNFVQDIAGCYPDYIPDNLERVVGDRIEREAAGERALLLYSGGVDSTVIGAIGQKRLGERLLAVTYDGGHLREGEIEEISRNAQMAGLNHKVVNAEDAFVGAIGKTIDPEEKRAAFREVYARLTREAALAFGASRVMQGTIAPDRIESGMTGGARIKTHHNSAGLNFGNLVEIHPIEDLFKDEVRALAKSLGFPLGVFNRPPFPGPGNFLRVCNIPVDVANLEVVQWADAQAREIIYSDERYTDVSQLVTAVLGRAVGVKGDKRVYGYIVGVRGVRTKDFMTAEGVAFDPDIQRYLSQKLCEHPLIVQVGFFPTDKPPATTEFE